MCKNQACKYKYSPVVYRALSVEVSRCKQNELRFRCKSGLQTKSPKNKITKSPGYRASTGMLLVIRPWACGKVPLKMLKDVGITVPETSALYVQHASVYAEDWKTDLNYESNLQIDIQYQSAYLSV